MDGKVETTYEQTFTVIFDLQMTHCCWNSLRINYVSRDYTSAVFEHTRQKLNTDVFPPSDFSEHVLAKRQKQTKIVMKNLFSTKVFHHEYPPGHLELFIDGKKVCEYDYVQPVTDDTLKYKVSWDCTTGRPVR